MLEQPGFSREIDPQAVSAYLAFNSIPAPLTIFAEARKLPPGHLLTWEGGEVALRRYARPERPPSEVRHGSMAEELAAELREVLDDSVRAHLVADVPVGVLLSGGVDSGGLAALASRHAGEPLRTFSIGFEEEGFDELSRARLVAERYGTDHHELVLRPDAVELLPKLVEAFDEPFGDSSALPTYLVSELAASEVKVALSGEGGDELFGGYYTYVADLLARRVGRLAALARPLAEALPSRTDRVGFDYKAKRFARAAALPPLERHHGWKEIFSPAGPGRAGRSGRLPTGTHSTSTAPATPKPSAPSRWRGCRTSISASTWSTTCWSRPTASAWPTRWSSASPFSTRRSPTSRFSLPTKLKVRGFAKKRLLRQALGAAAAAGDRPRPQAGLLDPDRRLAARPAGALRPRGAGAVRGRPPGPARSRRRDADARPPLLRPGGSQPPDLGPDGAYPLVRPLCPLTRPTSTRSTPSWSPGPRPRPGAADEVAGGPGRGDRLPERALAAHDADAEARRPRHPRRRRGRRPALAPRRHREPRDRLSARSRSPGSASSTTSSTSPAAPKLLGQVVAVVIPVSAGVTVENFTVPFFGRLTPGTVDLLHLPAAPRSSSATSPPCSDSSR